LELEKVKEKCILSVVPENYEVATPTFIIESLLVKVTFSNI